MEAENRSAIASSPAKAAGAGEDPVQNPTSAEGAEQQDLFPHARRRRLPNERKSITHKFSVGSHEGYLIVGTYEEGAPGEVFIKMAKEGSTLSGFMDGVAVSISIGLQYGVPLKVLVDKLTNTRFEPSGFTENPNIRYASSVLDYIARWLGGKFLSPEYFKPRATSKQQEPIQAAPGASSVIPRADDPNHRGNGGTKVGEAPSCPTCGMLMVPNGSCYKCVNCGSTSGCS